MHTSVKNIFNLLRTRDQASIRTCALSGDQIKDVFDTGMH